MAELARAKRSSPVYCCPPIGLLGGETESEEGLLRLLPARLLMDRRRQPV